MIRILLPILKMLRVVFWSSLIGAVFCVPIGNFSEAADCNPGACKLPDCLCGSSQPPGGLSPKEIPQLVLLTFDDAVNVINYNYYERAFFHRKNPDGCPIGVTYFLSHEYTDYSKVHDLWRRGYEIATHSITHQTPTDYWKSLGVEEHKKQFADQIDLINEFAKIPKSEIKGMRLPFLQLSGDNSFKMIEQTSLSYDCSWSSLSYVKNGLWPYTLDFKSVQDCPIGPCPVSSIPGVWVLPMIDWEDQKGFTCAMVDACPYMPAETDALLEIMIKNFKRHYEGTRSPFGFYVHAAWFDKNPNNFEAYLKFLDYLQTFEDVHLVTAQRALEWVRNPSDLKNLKNSWPTCAPVREDACGTPKACKLAKGEEERYMTLCGNVCPNQYPWLGNPLGA